MNEERIQSLKELLTLDPADRDLYFLLGKALLDAGQWEEAVQRLSEAASLNPDLPAIWRFWGEALNGKGEIELARKVWSEGIKISDRTGDLQAGKEMKVFLKRFQ